MKKPLWLEIASSQLWLLPAALLGVLITIEHVHTKYHMNADNDPHGYCKNFIKKQQQELLEDDW